MTKSRIASHFGANMADGESVALDAATDQLASLSVSEETGGDHKNENGTRPNADVLVADPDLWKPGPPPEDCPVCMVPLPIENDESAYFSCCGKMVCTACVREAIRATMVINSKRAKKELPPVEGCCPFCRTSTDEDRQKHLELIMIRAQKDDREAVYSLASDYRDGRDGVPKDESKAVDLYIRAAELGCTKAMVFLGVVYQGGIMGTEKDKDKARYFYENATRGGNLTARCTLAAFEEKNDNIDLAIRHWRLAAEGGHPIAMKKIWKVFSQGSLSKATLEKILRAHQTAVDERKSEDRDRHLAYKKAIDADNETLKEFYRQYYRGIINAKELNNALKAFGYKP